jgi:amidase
VTTFITRFDAGAGAHLRVAVKDLIDMEGEVTTCGCRAVAARAAPATRDAACLAALRSAERMGKVRVVGKTNLHELAYGVSGINQWYGTPVNPLDPSRVPGGSSSGSAVAVGAGEADVALGTDSGGSIRIPAACCGVVGLKTTWGRLPLGGIRPLAPSLDTVGPLARDVAGVIAGMQLLEPGFEPAGRRGRRARVGRLRPSAGQGIDAAVDAALSASGLEVVEVATEGWGAADAAARTVLEAEAWEVNGPLLREDPTDIGPDVAERLERGSHLGAAKVEGAWRQAASWRRELEEVFKAVDVLALPTLSEPPPLLADGARVASIRYSLPVNLAGLPALAMPVGGAPIDGWWPASLQLVGPLGAEELLVAVGLAVEAGRP